MDDEVRGRVCVCLCGVRSCLSMGYAARGPDCVFACIEVLFRSATSVVVSRPRALAFVVEVSQGRALLRGVALRDDSTDLSMAFVLVCGLTWPQMSLSRWLRGALLSSDPGEKGRDLRHGEHAVWRAAGAARTLGDWSCPKTNENVWNNWTHTLTHSFTRKEPMLAT